MLKKASVLLASLVLFMGLWLSVRPVFYGRANRLELYLKSNSSNAQIVRVNGNDLQLASGVKGECFKTDKKSFELEDFLLEFQAKKVLEESTQDGQSIYAYSPKIRYCRKIQGKTVNLQVFVGKEEITVGTPLIFGGY